MSANLKHFIHIVLGCVFLLHLICLTIINFLPVSRVHEIEDLKTRTKIYFILFITFTLYLIYGK